MASNDSFDIFQYAVDGALALPSSRVNREEYLREVLLPHADDEVIDRALPTSQPKAGGSLETLDKCAADGVRWHTLGVTSVSDASGLLGRAVAFAGAVGDLVQMFYHIPVISQKPVHIHGRPESAAQRRPGFDDETRAVLTLLLGVAFGVNGAATRLQYLAAELGKESAKRLARQALTKLAFYRLARPIAKWFGIKLTKQNFATVFGRTILLVGAGVAGAMTWCTFGRGCERLVLHLRETELAQPNATI
jgi:hypothetical protein